MARRQLVIIPLIVGLVFVCTVTSQREINRIRQREFDDELLYLPSDKLLNHFTAGMASVIADVLWVRCIQYTTEHFKKDRKFTWLNHMCAITTRLDPHFVGVYRWGGMFLAALKADDNASIELLQRGMVANPEAWELPYEIAITYLLNRRDRPDSPIEAARYLGMAVETGNAPAFVVKLAADLEAKHDLSTIERSTWENMLKSDDKFLQQLATRKLQEVSLREICVQFDKAIEAYSARYGQPPKQLQDLVTGGIFSGIPEDPLGGKYFIDAAGKVQNTTILDERTDRARTIIQNYLDFYKSRTGNWPPDLQALVAPNGMTEIPPHPYADRTWKYDPQTGKVQ